MFRSAMKQFLAIALCLCLLCNLMPAALAEDFAITRQPVSVTVAEGAKAKVSVAATGEGLSYQWYYAKAGSSSFAKASITSAAYSVSMTESRDGRQVYCVITDVSGNQLTSNTVTLNMQHPVEITKQPANAYANAGEKAAVTVKATGDNLTYQWYIAKAGSSNFSKSSVKKATYSVNISASNNGRQAYCVVTDAYGNSVRTNTVTLNMITPLAITQQPQDVFVKEGATAKTSVAATGDGLSYQWYFKNAGATKFSKASITGSTYSISMTASRAGRSIYCVVTDQHGNSVTSDTVTLGMQTPLVITSQPKHAYAYAGKTAKTTVTATGENLTYQWYIASAASSKFSKSSITAASYSVKISDANNGRKAYCVITDAYGNTVKTDTVTFRMASPFAIEEQPQNAYAYEGNKASVTVSATGDNLKYQWYYASASSSKFSKASITSATYSVPMTASRDGRKVYCVITDVTGKKLTTETVTLTLAEPLSLVSPLEDLYAYDGTFARITPEVTGDGLTYRWFVSEAGSDTFVESSVTKATYSFTMSEAKSGRKIYCIVTDGCGTSITTNTITATLAANFEIITQPVDTFVNEGEDATVTVEAVGDNLTYQWWYANKGSDEFSKASITTAEYTVPMTAARDDRQLYCVITDITGNTLQTETVTIGMINSLDDKLASVVAAYGSSGSEYIRALRLYDWLCANVRYDYDYIETGIPTSQYGVACEAAMLDGVAVCQGYAEAYEQLLDRSGITAHFVTGYGNGGSHAWVIAQIDGNWYQFDPTWDEAGDGSVHNYFGLTDMAMRSDHTQYTQTHLLCNSYAANYEYRNHEYDDILATLRADINDSLKNNIYSGTLTPEVDFWSGFWWYPDYMTVASILNVSTDWVVDGRIDVTADPDTYSYSYQFYPDEVPVTAIEVKNVYEGQWANGYVGSEYYYLPTGYTDTLEIETTPENADLTFSSSDTSILKVTSTGKYTTYKEGVVTLTISSQSYSLELLVKVDNSSFHISNTSISQLSVKMDETLQLSFDCYFRTFADLSGTWSIEDTGIATVSASGLVTPKKPGLTYVTGTLGNYSTTNSIAVTLSPVTAILLPSKTFTASVGDKFDITFNVEVEDQTAYYESYWYNVGSYNWDIAHAVMYTKTNEDYWETGYYSYIFTVECFAEGTATLYIDPCDGGVIETFTIVVTK